MAAGGITLEAAQRMARHKSSSTTFKYQVESIKEREQIMRVLTDGGYSFLRARHQGVGAEKNAERKYLQ
jgi:hypothetical protein